MAHTVFAWFQSRVRVFVLSDASPKLSGGVARRFNLAFEFSFCLTRAVYESNAPVFAEFQSRVRVFVLSDAVGCATDTVCVPVRFQSRVRVFVLSDLVS